MVGDRANYSQDLCMYLDPFQSPIEKPVADLLLSLRRLGSSGPNAESALQSSSDSEILIRCARNIIAAVQDRMSQDFDEMSSGIDHLTALYGALWCFFITHDNGADVNMQAMMQDQRRTILPHIVFRMENHFQFDAKLLHDFVTPLLDSSYERNTLGLRVQEVIDKSSSGPETKPRNESRSKSVRYRVGQLFHHARYHYQGAIYGWDVQCTASEHWVRSMQVNSLERGKEQSFYHILYVTITADVFLLLICIQSR